MKDRIRIVGLVALAAAFMLGSGTTGAQRSGQNAKISIGEVVKIEQVQLQSDAAKGALVGGVIGYHTTSSSRSSSTKWGRAAAGAMVGGALKRRSEGNLTGMMYSVKLGNGSVMKIISDQTEIRQGDCVTVEEVKDSANIRRADPIMCEPESAAAVEAVSDELQEEAVECLAAKEALLSAETEQQLDLALRKIRILCND